MLATSNTVVGNILGVRLKNMEMNARGFSVGVTSGGTKEEMRRMIGKVEGVRVGASKVIEAHLS